MKACWLFGSRSYGIVQTIDLQESTSKDNYALKGRHDLLLVALSQLRLIVIITIGQCRLASSVPARHPQRQSQERNITADNPDPVRDRRKVPNMID